MIWLAVTRLTTLTPVFSIACRPPSSRSTNARTPATDAFCVAHSLDCAQRGSARGYYVLYYRNTVSFSDGSFEKFSRTVSLWLFSHSECTQRGWSEAALA